MQWRGICVFTVDIQTHLRQAGGFNVIVANPYRLGIWRPAERSSRRNFHHVFVRSCFSIASVTLAEGARRLPAAETALLSALETPLAPVWAFLFFTDVPPFLTLVGGGIIFVAVLYSQSVNRRRIAED